ncbi:DUF4232 domain-containing protein [Streptomyces sp. CB02460]|uniref:DUF4232 domain-containing protein n=1 Tax=Streptomyces sp. CB02460 TaxID=1703941 RepID=UPI00093BBB3C|nr:DUF4232 domain-containing protein [Streptomyces sp. CB02460]OKJ70585.1 hypothetical protein AMK30_27280 [Streptomyces sp. CB02460]
MRSNRIRTTVLAATAALAALSLTACGGNDGTDAKKPAASVRATDDAPTTAPDKDSTAPTDTEPASDTAEPAEKPATEPAEKPAESAEKPASKPKPAPKPKTPVTCTGANTKVTVTKVTRPINHLLLTVTNTGDRPCYAYHAPMLRFDGAQAVFRVLRDSKPQAVVTLDPGGSAYAGIGLTGEPNGRKPYPSKHLGVTFADRNDGPVNSASTELTLPAGTYWDDNGFVTYWQSEMDQALVY